MKYNKTISHNLTQSSSGFQIPVCPPSFWRVSFSLVHLTFLLLTSFVFLLTSNVLAQEAKQTKSKVEVKEQTTAAQPNAPQASGDKVEFKNETTNSILTITDEGNNAGSITLPSVGSTLSGNKFYNNGGNLYWGGNQLGTSGSAGGWTDVGSKIHTTTSTDNVGIGTSNPKSKLSVGGDGDYNVTISGTTTTGRGVLGLATTGTGVVGKATTGAGVFGYSIDGYGIRGQTLEGSAVYGSAGDYDGSTENAIGVSGRAYGTNGKGVYGTASSLGYAGYFSGRTYFSYNVGIGELSPLYKLHIKSEANTFQILKVENTSSNSNADGIVIDINRSNPGGGNRYLWFRQAGSPDPISIGSVSGNGGGGVAYNTTSDARLKMKVEKYSNALETLLQVGIKKYERISNPGVEEVGVIAQELQKVYPQAVTGSPDSDVKTNPMMVDYSKLTPLLAKAIQEQQEIIKTQVVSIKYQDMRLKALEKQNLEYKNENASLENRLSKIESLFTETKFTSVKK